MIRKLISTKASEGNFRHDLLGEPSKEIELSSQYFSSLSSSCLNSLQPRKLARPVGKVIPILLRQPFSKTPLV